MKHTYVHATSFALLLCLASMPAAAAENETTTQPLFYTCANGMILEVSHLSVRRHGAVEITFPTGRDIGAKTKRLLPATQTGSGERYASDITEFHVKGDTAHFATAASAQSEAISRVICHRAIAEAEEKPVTQSARAGRYFIIHPDGPVYNRVETICFAEDGRHYFGVSQASEPEQVIAYNGRNVRTADVSPVDAGVGQRRYTLTDTRPSGEKVTLHFIAPGMREMGLPSATAGLSSISQENNRLNCVDNDRILYVGTTTERGIVITREDDGLAFRSFGDKQDIVWPEMRQGYVTFTEDHSVFEFLDGDNRVRITTNHNGFLVEGAWSLDTPIAQRSEAPEAYFVADRHVFGKDVPILDQATSHLLTSLSTCNYLAGETSENAKRNADIKTKWDAAGCEKIPDAHTNAIRSAPVGSPLRDYLKRHSPNWI